MASCFWEVLKGCIVDKVKSVYYLIKNHNSNLNQLHDMHRQLRAKKDDIARKVENGESKLEQVTNEATEWLRSVEELLEDEQVKDHMNEDYIRAKDQCCFGLFRCNWYQRYGMSRLAKAKADEMQQKFTGFPQEPVTHPIRTMDLEPIPTGHCKGLKTREEVEQRILELLKDDHVDAVGIYGMGGIGKTTLAKGMKDEGAKDMFDLTLMVEISQEPNIRRIQDELAASVDLTLDSQLSVDDRAKKVFNALKIAKRKQSNKDQPTKMLIILDNIWKDLELHELGIPSEKTPQFCCKLLFTSRDMDVCRSMGVHHTNIVQVDILNDDESKSLFWEQVGNNEYDDQDKRSLEHKLLSSCGGLPLAIKALARMLRGKNVEKWNYYAQELQQPISRRSDRVRDEKTEKILELSFNAIPNDEMKRFFLLACLFPNGESISIGDLMRYGIGLDLFHRAEFLSDAITEATMWAEELITSSLLLREPFDKFSLSVRIHDVIRSYALSFAGKRGNRLIVGAIPQLQMDRIVQECTAISIRDDEDFSCLNGMDFNRLEMLMIDGSHRPFELDDAFFMRMVHLQVLDSTYVDFIRLPKSITNLTSLKTLQLDSGILRDEDMQLISELVELRVLSIRRSNIKMLPHEMTKLINLRLLDLTGCEELRKVPANVIGGLTKLEGLYMKECWSMSWINNKNMEEQESGEASLAELNSLRRLKVLQIYVPEIEQPQTSDEFFTTLHSFDICVGSELRYKRSGYELEAGLSGKFMVKFECLEWILRYPRLMERLCKSDYLKVDGKTITDDEKGKDVVSYLNKERFSNLKTLKLRNLKGLMRIYDEGQISPEKFSNLRHLSLFKLVNLESYVLPIDVAPNLTTLKVQYCESLKFIWMDLEHGGKSKSPMAVKIKELPYLKKLTLKHLPQLQDVLGDAQGSTSTSTDIISTRVLFSKIIFSSMEELHIDDIGEYVKLWDIPDTMEKMRTSTQFQFCNQLQNLKSLTIRGSYELKALSPSIANALVQLQSLTIARCSNMKEVISKETEETEISSKMIIFSKLTKLELVDLDQLECFYRGSYELQFPALEDMFLLWLGNYKRLFVEQENSQGVFPKKTEFPCLEELCLGRVEWNMVDNVGYLDIEKVNRLKSLKHLTLSDVEWKHIFLADAAASGSLEGLRQLEMLTILDCKNIEAVIEIEPMGQQPQQEEAVVVVDDDDDDGSGAGAGISMPSSSLYLQLPQLWCIRLRNCKNLRWFISTSTETGHDHVNFVVDLPSLTEVDIYNCSKMEEFSSGPITLKAPNLSLVEVTRRSTTFRMEEGEDINNFLRSIYTRHHNPQSGDERVEEESSSGDHWVEEESSTGDEGLKKRVSSRGDQRVEEESSSEDERVEKEGSSEDLWVEEES